MPRSGVDDIAGWTEIAALTVPAPFSRRRTARLSSCVVGFFMFFTDSVWTLVSWDCTEQETGQGFPVTETALYRRGQKL